MKAVTQAIAAAAALTLLAAGCTTGEPAKDRTARPAAPTASAGPATTSSPMAFAGLPATAQAAFATFAGVPSSMRTIRRTADRQHRPPSPT